MKTKNKKKKDKKAEMPAFDERLLESIQPRGGITFKDPNYIIAGDGYVRILHVYQLPKNIDSFWLDNVFNIPDAIASIDVSTRDSAEVKKNINKSLKEEFARAHSAKDYMELYDAQQRQSELTNLLHELSAMGEVMKMVDFRIYVKGRNLIELDDRCETIMKNLESDSYLTTTFINEGKREWQALWEPYKKQQEKRFSMKGQPLMTEQVAMGYPFDYSELIDESGDFLGFTPVNGVVVFNEWERTPARKCYDSVVVGDKGSGKSTLLKKRFKSNACKGNFIRTFDVTGEFAGLTKEFGGKIIKCNGEEGMLNPLEILKAGEDDDTSYSRHISKVSTFFKCILPSADDKTILLLGNYLREFYEEYELVPAEDREITGRPASSYPTFSDFLRYLIKQVDKLSKSKTETEVETELYKIQVHGLAEIIEAVKSIVNNYGAMFDGHTSVDNIVDEKIVTFDISSIKDLGNVFVAQMFNMVSLCWDNAVNNGEIMKAMWENRDETGIGLDDITCFLILIDESHRWVNTSMPMILDLLIKYLREARKYFAGITFASQSVRDFCPQGANSPHVDLITTLFELTQYKFVFRQDSNTLPLLNTIFRNALTYSQIEQVPYLDTGETILSINGDRSIRFNVWLSRGEDGYEEKLFSGGR